jgi:SAM-dependent methyltransferase
MVEQQLTGLTEELKEEMKKHVGFSQDHIQDHYDEIAKKYDAIYLNSGYHDPLHCAQLVQEFVPNSENVEIFDMGCGTGLVGFHLKELGYTKIAGCDASQGMLDVAGEKKAYHDLKAFFLGIEQLVSTGSAPKKLGTFLDSSSVAPAICCVMAGRESLLPTKASYCCVTGI